ncbi:sterol O-acyltransferase 1-like [Oppia nitens]|uniref:sterol O-acyltransferase 1-like n=1 Tax=Oppia nitens TaxID=1686743 RepID=UPI0023DB2528|nr:sterol O-acyltransferase 1-like [Oppia nitens]
MSQNNWQKKFVIRDSTLTELFGRIQDMRSAYNLISAIFTLIFATTLLHYVIDNNELYADLRWLNWCFSNNKFHLLAFAWLKMQMSAVLILYPVLRIWLWIKANKKISSDIHTIILVLISLLYQSFLFIYGYKFVQKNSFSCVCRFALLIEQVRLSMKSHSFIIENRFRNIEYGKDKTSREAPTLSQLLYFLIAPTLLYRDNYARTSKIRWRFVFWYFFQVFLIIFAMFAISWRFVEHYFKWTGVKPFETKQLIYIYLMASLVGIQLKLLLFYGMLHCWLNGFAEMLRFGDRNFYNDWWNCTDFVTFYRKWNGVVHEWLREYIFKPTLYLTSGNKGVSALTVFLVSAIIHEYILSVSFGFFLPVLFCSFFIIGVMLFFIGKIKFKVSQNKRSAKTDSPKHNSSVKQQQQETNDNSFSLGNMLMFMSLCLGWGLMLMLYSMESYSRINCPSNDTSLSSYLWPRFLSCVIIN